MNFHIFHHDDADGYASAAVLMRYYLPNIDALGEDTVTTYSCNYNYPMDLSDVEPGDAVFILDYSLSTAGDKENIVNLYNHTTEDIYWIDHHASSSDAISHSEEKESEEEICIRKTLKKIAKNGLIYTVNDYAGCMLTYIWCFTRETPVVGKQLIDANEETKSVALSLIHYIAESAPTWIKLVSDHDTFKHTIPNSAEFCLAVTHHGLNDTFINPDLVNFSNLDNPDEQEVERYTWDGLLLMSYQNNQNAKLLQRNGFVCDLEIGHSDDDQSIPSYTIACLNGYGNSFVFGDYYNEVDAVVIFNFDGINWRYSMFSKADGYCCKEFAELMYSEYKLNGGGHDHAAGWSAPLNIFDKNSPECNRYKISNIRKILEYDKEKYA